MQEVFFTILNMSISGGLVIAVILIARLLLKRAPKKWSYLLWGAAAFRLCCPVSIKMALSLFRFVPTQAASSGANGIEYIHRAADMSNAAGLETVLSSNAPIQSAMATYAPAQAMATQVPVHEAVNAAPVDIAGILGTAATIVWLLGAAALIGYNLFFYINMRRNLATAVRMEGNVFESDHVRSPFILGIFNPRIHIPFGLDEHEKEYVLAHERYHLKRGDHIIKVFSFILLALHWFNPLCWLAFFLSNKDMEMSCDEKVLGENPSIRKQYSTTLLSFAVGRQFPTMTPLAFGESGVRSRIKNAMNYSKPKFFVTVLAVVLCLAVITACVANPTDKDNKPDTTEQTAQASETVATEEADKTAYVPKGVTFADAEFEKAFREEFGIKGIIFKQEILDVTEIDFSQRGITNIEDIAMFKNLESLNLNYDFIEDISALRGLTKLQIIGLDNCGISDISPLAGLTDLECVGLECNSISDISPLSGLKKIESLNLGINDIKDIKPLSGMTNLRELSILSNEISDISPLSELTSLEYLDLAFNDVSDVSALKKLTKLKTLDLNCNSVGDISALSGMTDLEMLDLNNSREIKDISMLAGMTKMRELVLTDNSISDISALAGMVDLRVLNISINEDITDISALSGLKNLEELYMLNSGVKDISALYGLTNLKTLEIGCSMSDISALSGLTNLEELDLWGGKFRDISALSGLKRLKTLKIHDIEVDDISALSTLINLKTVYLDGTNVPDEQMDEIKALLPNCYITRGRSG